MKTVARLCVGMVLASAMTGACLLAYMLGYAEGLGAYARTVETPIMTEVRHPHDPLPGPDVVHTPSPDQESG
jgi:hypothetical protein